MKFIGVQVEEARTGSDFRMDILITFAFYLVKAVTLNFIFVKKKKKKKKRCKIKLLKVQKHYVRLQVKWLYPVWTKDITNKKNRWREL